MKKRDLLLAFFLSVLLGTIIVLPNIIVGKGIFSLVADFNYQQIPFLMTINKAIKTGEVLWNWSNEAGSSFIGSYAFYNLLSPFNIITYLFPASFVKYLVGPIFILKYGVAGLTSYLYIRRYTRTNKSALVGSLLYAFSGFQLTNMLFYHFHDVVALFPLLLYTFDRLVYDNKKGIFAIMVFISALTNWFFFIGEVIFIIIYYFVKIFSKEIKFDLKKLLNIIVESVIGVGLAMFILYPVMLYTIGNPRVSSSWTVKSALLYPLINYIEIIRGIITPSEVMSFRAIINSFNYNSIEGYLPLVGIVLVIPYLIKNIKKWDSILLIICVVCMFIPVLNSMFYLFQTTYYARWFFIPILMMALISAKTLENNYKILSGIIVTLLMLALLIGLIMYYRYNVDYNILYNKVYIALIAIFAIVNIIILVIACSIKRHKYSIIIVGIFIFVTIWGNYMTYIQKGSVYTIHIGYIDFLNSSKNLDQYNNSRFNSSTSCNYNYGNVSDTKNLFSWNSNIPSSSFNFLETNGITKRGVSTIIPISEKSINDFLGVNYVLSCDDNEDLNAYKYECFKKLPYYKIYKNNDAYPIGVHINEYISQKDYNKISLEKRKYILLKSVVLNEKQISKYKNLFNNANINSKFTYEKNGFKSKIISDKETFIIYQIPYDKGWKAKVNNKIVDIENVDYGLIGIPINKGVNKITFKYSVPGLKEGLIASVISLIIYIIYIIYNIKIGGKYEKS